MSYGKSTKDLGSNATADRNNLVDKQQRTLSARPCALSVLVKCVLTDCPIEGVSADLSWHSRLYPAGPERVTHPSIRAFLAFPNPTSPPLARQRPFADRVLRLGHANPSLPFPSHRSAHQLSPSPCRPRPVSDPSPATRQATLPPGGTPSPPAAEPAPAGPAGVWWALRCAGGSSRSRADPG